MDMMEGGLIFQGDIYSFHITGVGLVPVRWTSIRRVAGSASRKSAIVAAPMANVT